VNAARVTDEPVPLPVGFRIVLDRDTVVQADGALVGGRPRRLIRLTAAGRSAVTELRDRAIRTASEGALARRLVDAGLAHPLPPVTTSAPDVTVVIPVRDRPRQLADCLAALGGGHPTLVVDDGSRDPHAVAEVVAETGAKLIQRVENGGPGAARNTALAHVDTELVAFLDSDCRPPDAWIEKLAGHFADPLVVAVAPRVIARPRAGGIAGGYARVRGPLDLGDRPGLVAPGRPIGHVPTAALLVRRRALAADGSAFTESLRYGEDVDLVWRLHDRGGRIRYEPAVRVGHDEPRRLPDLLARRYRYGTSAGPLARRHPGRLDHFVAHPAPALAIAGAALGRPVIAGLGVVATAATIARARRPVGLTHGSVATDTGRALGQTALGAGRYLSQIALPAVVLAAAAPGARRRRRTLVMTALVLAPTASDWMGRRRAGRDRTDPFRHAAISLADDVAYGAGVWTGCVRARTSTPLLPAICLRFPQSPPADRRSPNEGS
jgi:mycofactocin system glycosyltransferase